MNDVQADTVQAKKTAAAAFAALPFTAPPVKIHTNSHIKEVQQMILYKRFLLIITVIACTAGALCGVMTAKINTERRLYGEQKTLPAQEEPMTENDPSGDAQSQPDQPVVPKTNNAAQRTLSLANSEFSCAKRNLAVHSTILAAWERNLAIS